MGKWVRTASVYVDDVDSPEEATAMIEDRNEDMVPWGIYIRLPDEDSEHVWEET